MKRPTIRVIFERSFGRYGGRRVALLPFLDLFPPYNPHGSKIHTTFHFGWLIWVVLIHICVPTKRKVRV